jgi:acetyl-CoA synthetase
MHLIQSAEEYRNAYQKSIKNPEEFWAEIALNFVWKKPWNKVLSWNFNDFSVRWFDAARLNITENCLDRHLSTIGDQPAIIWEPNNPEEAFEKISYNELYQRVIRFARALQSNGVKKGDRVCIYMGMIPQLTIAVLACARIGAIHSVIFGGFSAQSIADRVIDAGAEFIITCDGAFRGAKEIPLKATVDEALTLCDTVKKVIVFKRTGRELNMIAGRDLWWHEIEDENKENILANFTAEEMDAEDPLFILYTSGSTGKPKGVVHSCGGYMVWTNYTFRNVFQYQPGQIYFCTADIGWITGHSYMIYGPLSAGATVLMFEGIPTYPTPSRLWDIVDKHRVNILYTAPTAIRSLMSFDESHYKNHDLRSLQVLGTVGEPINEEAWQWFHKNIGRSRCPVVDTWWQTETGGIMISNLAGVTPAKPTYATLPLPGVFPCLVDEFGNEITENEKSGNLCIKQPWPGMIRTTYGDHERCKQNYFSAYKGLYFTGDGCYRDKDGNYRITGRVDDVLNVSGHRIGTAEVENAINRHPGVIESAVVGFYHEIKGQGIYAYVILDSGFSPSDEILHGILHTVNQHIGPIARPDIVQFVPGLPKTRSGKIMRRILRKIAENDFSNLGDISTLLDPGVVEEIVKGRK